MTTWRELLSEETGAPDDLVRWWLSDRMDAGLTSLPLDRTAAPKDREAFLQAARRLAGGEPVQYVCGRAPFRDLTLQVDPRVLIPRPETEQLVQIALERVIRPGDRVLDVGTGSGCIALAVKHECPDCTVEGRDVSADALQVARANAEHLGLDVRFTRADLLSDEPPGSCNVILSNPPYIGESERSLLPANVREYEPERALFADEDGLALIRQLLKQALDVLVQEGRMLLETGETQHPAINAEAKRLGWEVESLPDLTGRDRFIFLQHT